MFTESEVDPETNFVPKVEKLYGYPWKICKECIHKEKCPLWYQCENITKWKEYYHEDLDDDDTL